MSITSPAGVRNATLEGGAQTLTRTEPSCITRRWRLLVVERSVTELPPLTCIVPMRAMRTIADSNRSVASVAPIVSRDADPVEVATSHGRPSGQLHRQVAHPAPATRRTAAARATRGAHQPKLWTTRGFTSARGSGSGCDVASNRAGASRRSISTTESSGGAAGSQRYASRRSSGW